MRGEEARLNTVELNGCTWITINSESCFFAIKIAYSAACLECWEPSIATITL